MNSDSAKATDATEPIHLKSVTTGEDICENIRRFEQDRKLTDFHTRAERLVAHTTYWVYDEERELFGPGKFVGYKQMTFDRYNASFTSQHEGEPFDGGVTRKSIAKVLGDFDQEESLKQELRSWVACNYGEKFASEIDANKWRFTCVGSNRKYWTVVCNPDKYNGLAAVQALEEITWTIDRDGPKIGDRVLVWQSKGSGDFRGVIAVGEVIANRQLIDDLPGEAQFWKTSPNGPTERIRISLWKRPGLPLWESDKNPFLAELPVAKAYGGTLFTLKCSDWRKVIDRIGTNDIRDLPPPISYQGQGFRIDPKERKAIELWAQRMAEKYFIDLGYEVKDVSRNQSFDLLCMKGDEELRVEVKGSTASAQSVFMTHCEIEHAKKHPGQVVLFVVDGIELKKEQDTVEAVGGNHRIYWPWVPDDSALKPIQYQYTLPLTHADNPTAK